MFDSLVESGSHKEDFARKSSFFIGTAIIYGIVLLAIAIGSIYLYNESLGDPNLELVTLVAPVPVQTAPEPKVQPKDEPKPAAASKEPQVSMRQEISVIAPVVKSQQVAKVETREIARNVPVVLGNRNIDAAPTANVGPIGPASSGGGTGTGVGPVVSIADDPPPPKPSPPKRVAPISGGVLNGKAISKPQPVYPPIAKAARASGTVTVQIVVDETGKVISASAVGGHPLLQQAAVGAARQARFSPTLLSGQPVKVSGVITYNFVLQ